MKDVVMPVFTTLKLNSPFKEYRLRPCFRQPSSLLQLLRKKNRQQITGVSKCNDKKCMCCQHLIIGTTFKYMTQNGTEKRFEVKSNMNCGSMDVIYAIQCRGCNLFYVGQTGDTLRARILHVSNHIATCAEQLSPLFYAMPILKLPPNCSKLHREQKEKQCIKYLGPTLNRDM